MKNNDIQEIIFQKDESVVSYLVLDYNKPFETEKCLESIKQYSDFKYKVYLLVNGGDPSYAYNLFKKGLIDHLIYNKQNIGCGLGTIQLFNICDTKYAIYMQNDQSLCLKITQDLIDRMIKMFQPPQATKCISLSGFPAGQGNYSERAHLIDVDFYNSIPKSIGGPGPFNNIKYSEQSVQEFFQEKKYTVIAVQPPLVVDNGKWSIREIGDGIYKHRCDTKQFYVIKKPTYRTDIYPPLNDAEWKDVLEGRWEDGRIPEEWKPHSFIFWGD